MVEWLSLRLVFISVLSDTMASSGVPSSTTAAPLAIADPMPCLGEGQALQLGLRRVRGKQPPSAAWRAPAEQWQALALASDEALHGDKGKLPVGSRSTLAQYTHGGSGQFGVCAAQTASPTLQAPPQHCTLCAVATYC